MLAYRGYGTLTSTGGVAVPGLLIHDVTDRADWLEEAASLGVAAPFPGARLYNLDPFPDSGVYGDEDSASANLAEYAAVLEAAGGALVDMYVFPAAGGYGFQGSLLIWGPPEWTGRIVWEPTTQAGTAFQAAGPMAQRTRELTYMSREELEAQGAYETPRESSVPPPAEKKSSLVPWLVVGGLTFVGIIGVVAFGPKSKRR
jgi:hypothetical protein